MTSCRVTSEAPVTATADALCGTLQVPEDRSRPDGRTTTLRVAVVPALSPNSADDAFVPLAGGPGRAGTAFFGWLPGLFSEVHATRDIVIVDQRGTGGSDALDLPPMPDLTGLGPAAAQARLSAWYRGWAASVDADPRQYTSTVAADDLDAVRQALGYAKVDLYGPSYGATLAQYYIRQHPDHVRLAIMDGGTPLDVPVFERMAASSQGALQLLFSRCRSDAACRSTFPDLAKEWRELAAELADGVTTDITDPATGRPGVATLQQVGPGVHQSLLDPAPASRLPLAVHLAHAGRWHDVAAVLPESSGSGGAVQAMSEVILCSEAWARFDVREVQRQGRGSYLLPGELAEATARADLCRAIPRGVVPVDDAAPVVSGLPILWLTGDGDPQDPPANLAAVPAQQPNARIVVMPAQQHTVGHSGCAPHVIAAFVQGADQARLDTSCIEKTEVPRLAFVLR